MELTLCLALIFILAIICLHLTAQYFIFTCNSFDVVHLSPSTKKINTKKKDSLDKSKKVITSEQIKN